MTVETEEGTETIFTDAELEPGRVYFMRPLNNPFPVDPIMVAAGKLIYLTTAESTQAIEENVRTSPDTAGARPIVFLILSR